MILFLDTEFTGLGQRWPRMISIALVSEDGQHEFYAELAAKGYIDKCTPWVKENVLPLLEGGDRIMQPHELRQRLTEWIGALGAVRIAVDSEIDFDFLRSTLDPWPANIDPKRLFIAGGDFAEAVDKIQAEDKSLRLHHALDDAKVNRLGWQARNNSIERAMP